VNDVTYIDVHGKRRFAKFIEYVPYVTPYGIAARYLIDGSILQIPLSCWELVTVLQ
jgi:hypothetical protein